jgi:hypothetical protein
MNNGDKKWFREYLDVKFNSLEDKVRMNREEIKSIKFTASVVGGLGGVIAAIATYFGINGR